MVNRTIQQKDRKRKMRGKHRKHSTQFVNTGSGPAPGAVSILYRHKLIDDHVDQYLASKFPQRSPIMTAHSSFNICEICRH